MCAFVKVSVSVAANSAISPPEIVFRRTFGRSLSPHRTPILRLESRNRKTRQLPQEAS